MKLVMRMKGANYEHYGKFCMEVGRVTLTTITVNVLVELIWPRIKDMIQEQRANKKNRDRKTTAELREITEELEKQTDEIVSEWKIRKELAENLKRDR